MPAAFRPLDGQSYCTTADGTSPVTNAPAPLQDLFDFWDNQDPANRISHPIDTHGPNGFGAGNRLIDSLASTGAIVLPMSYSNGTRLTGPSAAPTFSTAGYTPDNVGNTSPDEVAQWLDDELVSIHKNLAQHSYYRRWTFGGGPGYLSVVDSAWSIPATRCCPSIFARWTNQWHSKQSLHPSPIQLGMQQAVWYDSPLAQYVSNHWKTQDHDDFVAQMIEQKSPIFTAVGTQGDAVWDLRMGRYAYNWHPVR